MTPEEIARGLSPVRAEALCQLEAWSAHTRKALIDAGLAVRGKTDRYRPFYYSSYRYPFLATPLGLAVRDILKEQDNAD